VNNPPQIFSIADIEAKQIERTSTRYPHGLIRRLARKLARWFLLRSDFPFGSAAQTSRSSCSLRLANGSLERSFLNPDGQFL